MGKKTRQFVPGAGTAKNAALAVEAVRNVELADMDGTAKDGKGKASVTNDAGKETHWKKVIRSDAANAMAKKKTKKKTKTKMMMMKKASPVKVSGPELDALAVHLEKRENWQNEYAQAMPLIALMPTNFKKA